MSSTTAFRLNALLAACALFGAGASAAAAATPAPAAASAPCPGAGLRPTAANIGRIDAATLCLVNRVRVADRLPALRGNAQLRGVATAQIDSMLRGDYFADIGPSGRTPFALVAASSYHSSAAVVSVGQDIAWGSDGYSTPARIVASWMASPPHREVILDGSFRDAGAGAAPAIPQALASGHSGATYVIEFARRL